MRHTLRALLLVGLLMAWALPAEATFIKNTVTNAANLTDGQLLVGDGGAHGVKTFAACTDGLIVTWSSGAIVCGSISAANPALSNLSSVAINTALLPGTAGTIDLGSAAKPFEFLWLSGTSGTPGTNNFKFTGAATAARTITLPDASYTPAGINIANAWTAGVKQTFAPNGTTAGLNVGSVAGDPSTPANGDKWYDSTGNKFRCRENGVSVNCIGGGTTYTFRDNLLNSSSTIDWQPDPTVVWINEEFCGGGTASGSVASYGWKATDVVGTGSFNTPSGSLPNLCQWYVLSGATSGNVSAMSLHDLGNNGAGTLGDHTGTLPWEANLVFKMGQTATTAQWIGLVNNSALSITPADFIGVRWDTTLDTTNFSFVCRAAGVETGNKTDTTIAADTTFHRIRIYSSVANQINFELYSSTGTLQKQSLNACTTTANIPTASLTLAFQSGTRAASGAQLNADFASYKRRVAR